MKQFNLKKGACDPSSKKIGTPLLQLFKDDDDEDVQVDADLNPFRSFED